MWFELRSANPDNATVEHDPGARRAKELPVLSGWEEHTPLNLSITVALVNCEFL